MLDPVIENSIINDLAGRFSRSPLQQNRLHESDAEIITFTDNCGGSIAVSIDSLSEEIETKLYDDPYLVGWMIVMVNFSDIAAAGAEPVGIMVSEILPQGLSKEFIDRMQEGINDAVTQCGTFVLGGDTNTGTKLTVTGCAIGRSADNKYLKRTGCSADDILYSTGKTGSGNAYAITKLLAGDTSGFHYSPVARLKEARTIKKFASSCIDTSDGVVSALDQLMRLNNCGFSREKECISIIDDLAARIAAGAKIPEWLLLAGQHGEFELMFTIPPENDTSFMEEANNSGWEPVKLGIVTRKPGIRLNLYNKMVTLDSCRIRNLPILTGGNIKRYLQALLEYNKEIKETAYINY